MLAASSRSVQDLFDKSNGFLIDHSGGLLELLTQYKAYSDPVRKKSLFFAALMKNHKFWFYKDDSNLGTPVDYHEIRGHLRFGSVKIISNDLYEKILKQQLVTREEDIEIRRCVFDAIMYISKSTGITSSKLHYFFWNLFRNCCNRNSPHCEECLTECGLPSRYSKIKEQLNLKKCLLSANCISKKQSYKLIEHSTITDYY
jgi:hypothetical protein